MPWKLAPKPRLPEARPIQVRIVRLCKTVRRYFGTALDPRTGALHHVSADGEEEGRFPRLGDDKTEPAGTPAYQLLNTLPMTVPCFLDPEHDRVVFRRRATFSPIWMIFFVLCFLPSLAGGALLAKKALRSKSAP